MRHRRAVELLPDFGFDILDATTESDLVRHAEACSACRDWLAMRELLVSEMRPHAARLSHPEARVLALCAIRPDEVNELDREELRRHLDGCVVCREDLSVLRAAVTQARPRVAGSFEPAFAVPAKSKLAARPLLAAALWSALVLGSLVLAALALDRLPSGGGTPPSSPQFQAADRAPSFQELSSQTLDGERLIEGDHRLIVSDVKISKGANVSFHAGEVLAFGDGFRVEAGARMRAGSGSGRSAKSETSGPGGDGVPGFQGRTDIKRGAQ